MTHLTKRKWNGTMFSQPVKLYLIKNKFMTCPFHRVLTRKFQSLCMSKLLLCFRQYLHLFSIELCQTKWENIISFHSVFVRYVISRNIDEILSPKWCYLKPFVFFFIYTINFERDDNQYEKNIKKFYIVFLLMLLMFVFLCVTKF